MRIRFEHPRVDCARRNHEEQTAFGPEDCFFDLPLGADGRSKEATGLRLDGIDARASCFHCILHGWWREGAPMGVAEPQFEPDVIPVEGAPVKGVPVAGVQVRRSWQKHLLTFLMVFGPGLIVMEADNDAGAVSTYMQAGGQYGLQTFEAMSELEMKLEIYRPDFDAHKWLQDAAGDAVKFVSDHRDDFEPVAKD